MHQTSRFSRRQWISVSSSVSLPDDNPHCQHLGDPFFNWFVWIIKTNHDEKNDLPYAQKLEIDRVLVFQPYTLEYGVYKVKHEVRYVKEHYNKETTYCYFEIIPIPLHPLIIGGSLRYVYYKNNIELMSAPVLDPNYSHEGQPINSQTWFCNDTANTALCSKVITESNSLKKFGPFEAGKAYNFTMEVRGQVSTSVEFTNQVIVMSPNPIPSLLIYCLRNCGGKNYKSDTREKFIFEVKHSRQSFEMKKENVYNWSCSMNDNLVINIEEIRQREETPSFMLIVKENALKQNKKYVFKVTGEREHQGEAQIEVETFPLFKTLACKIKPTSGIAGTSKFSVFCTINQNKTSTLTLTLTLYDKHSKNDHTGLLLGSSYGSSFENITLTRGVVNIRATNSYGIFMETHVTATLSPPLITDWNLFLRDSLRKLKMFSEGYEKKLSFISSLCDMLNTNTSTKQEAIEFFLHTLSKEEASDLIEIELLLSTLQIILCFDEKCEKLNLNDNSYSYLSKILSEVSPKLTSDLVMTLGDNPMLTFTKVNNLYTVLLKCTGVLLTVHQKMLVNENYESVDFSIHELYKLGNLNMIKSLERINIGLAIKNLHFIESSKIQTEYIKTWIKEDYPTFFIKEIKTVEGGTFVKMSPQLANFLSKLSPTIVVQIMTFTQDPYWWSQTDKTSTDVISLSMGYKPTNQNYTSINTFIYPIDIFIKKNTYSNETVVGKVTQPDPKAGLDANDFIIAVHKINSPKGAKISAKFLELNHDDEFKVVLMVNQRPDYDHFDHAVIVNKSSPWYHSLTEIKDKEDIVFIGILPGPNVLIGETVNYKFQLQSTRCQVWYDVLWTTTGCSLGSNSTEEFIHCQCYHLSSIAGFIAVPVNTVNPFTDYALFLTIPDNPFVFALIVSILLLYMLLLVWTIKLDSTDMSKSALIVLEDNVSTDKYGYLVIVFTGSRLFAGTTSNIGLILHGSDTSSRSHILWSSRRPTLKRNSDDWFLLFSPKHLGTISSIQLWTDHSGPAPNWFCDKIYVRDLFFKKDYTFILGKWFGVTQVGLRVESFARPAKLEKEPYFVEFFLTNTILGFRESHSWISILSHHPRSPGSRSQRLSMAMVVLVMILLTSIMFYDVALPNAEDAPNYNLEMRDVLISLYSLGISAGINAAVYVAFRKSFIFIDSDTKKNINQDSRDVRLQVDSARILKVSKKSERTIKYYLKKSILSLRKRNFYPVLLKADSSSTKRFVIVHKVRAILAWIFCISVIYVTCFFIILFGLKIGKVKSKLWLTSTVMSLGEDIFVVDPSKIVGMSLLFGLVQTQLCDFYAYDPSIYQLKKGSTVKEPSIHDQFILKMRLQRFYKPISKDRLKLIQNHQIKITNWWAFIDIFDIVFCVIAVLLIISQAVSGEYMTNSLLEKTIFKDFNSDDNYIPSLLIRNVSSYFHYLQNIVLPRIYNTKWYNKQPLTDITEMFADTGWTVDSSHRLMGVPRLRQIRVKNQLCQTPPVFKNVTLYCNVIFSPSTEDTEDYGTQWKGFSWEDVLFSKSPWKYFNPKESSSVNIYTESGELFHGGGYIAELKRTQRKSTDIIWKLMDAEWLDIRTRVVFLEMSTYSVNDNMFTSIIFITEHQGSTLILSGKLIRSLFITHTNFVFEVIYFLYAILGLTKLVMILNTIGVSLFTGNFWTVYDLCFIVIGTFYFILHRVYLKLAALYVNDYQKSGKDSYFKLQTLIFHIDLDRCVLGLLIIFALGRSVRLFKYGTRVISIKQRYALFLSWPQIFCTSLIVCLLTFSIQKLTYLVNVLYQLGTIHWILYKMDFLHLLDSSLSLQNKFFIFLPCFVSYLSVFFYAMIIIKSYIISETMSKRVQWKQTLKE